MDAAFAFPSKSYKCIDCSCSTRSAFIIVIINITTTIMMRLRTEGWRPKPHVSLRDAVAAAHSCAHVRQRNESLRERLDEDFENCSAINSRIGYKSVYKSDRFETYARDLCSSHRGLTKFWRDFGWSKRQGRAVKRGLRRFAAQPVTPRLLPIPKIAPTETPSMPSPLSSAYQPVKRLYVPARPKQAAPKPPPEPMPKAAPAVSIVRVPAKVQLPDMEKYFSAWRDFALFAWKRRQLIVRVLRPRIYASLRTAFEAIRTNRVKKDLGRQPCKCVSKFARISKRVESQRIHDALAPLTKARSLLLLVLREVALRHNRDDKKARKVLLRTISKFERVASKYGASMLLWSVVDICRACAHEEGDAATKRLPSPTTPNKKTRSKISYCCDWRAHVEKRIRDAERIVAHTLASSSSSRWNRKGALPSSANRSSDSWWI